MLWVIPLVAAQTHPSPGKYTVRWCAMRLAKYFSRSKHNPWYVTINMVFYGLEQNNCNFSQTLFLEFDNITSHAGVIPCNYFSPMDWYICSYVIFEYVPCAQTLRRHRVDKWRTIYAANVVTTSSQRWDERARNVVGDRQSTTSLERPHNVGTYATFPQRSKNVMCLVGGPNTLKVRLWRVWPQSVGRERGPPGSPGLQWGLLSGPPCITVLSTGTCSESFFGHGC